MNITEEKNNYLQSLLDKNLAQILCIQENSEENKKRLADTLKAVDNFDALEKENSRIALLAKKFKLSQFEIDILIQSQVQEIE